MYAMMYFSDFMIDSEWRDSFGWAYITVLCLYMVVYIVMLSFNSFKILLQAAKRVFHSK